MRTWLPILTFHSVDDRRSVISFPPALFQHGLARLSSEGYRTLDLPEATRLIRRGGPFPDRSLVITFDDGYRTIYDRAFPVLQRFGMSATVFLTTGNSATSEPSARLPSLGGLPMLAWNEARTMYESGSIVFGAHTLTHPDLTRVPSAQVEAEIRDSRAIIEDGLGAPVTCFAYPFGRFDERSRRIVREHYDCACSDRLGLVTANSDLYALERVDAFYLRSRRLFDLMLTRLFPGYVRARSIPRRIRRAILSRRG